MNMQTKGNAPFAVAAAGLIAGTVDIIQAFIFFGLTVPLAIAAGLLGQTAFHGGAATWILGLLLHYFIATSFAAFYYAASRKLNFLIEHPLVCGLAYGAAVELVMTLVVLPLSALHARGPFKLHSLLLGLGVHMITVGLPISLTISRLAPPNER
jgi:hypothetical protein